jgi:glycosyltransferase involved in cell wall biosynthesis
MTFSIITVTYNAVKWLERTVQSIINQTYPDIEYIIVDGGSTDGTIDIIRNYELQIMEKYAFKWISEPDKGLYDAMNKGLKLATGNYIWFMNAGDRIRDSETVETIYQLQFTIVNSQLSIGN